MSLTRWLEALLYTYVLWLGYEETKAATAALSFCKSRTYTLQT